MLRKGIVGGIVVLLLSVFLIWRFLGAGNALLHLSPSSAIKTGEMEKDIPQVVPMNELAPTYTREATLIAVGDIMMHNTQTEAGYRPKTGDYNFDSFFTDVAPLLKRGDWVTGNLETPLAKGLTYTGYPMFNAPPELASSLKKAGFTILTTANNHAMDRGEKGIILTREALSQAGLLTTGTAGSRKEREEILLVTKNEITLAFLAYTYGTNGIPLPKGKEYLVSLIDLETMKEEVKKAKEMGADVVVLSIHFGQEYRRFPNEEQEKLVRELIGAGADLILGSHPHVVQPVQEIKVSYGKGEVRKGVVIYSLGNFIAAQNGRFTNLGVIFSAVFRKAFPSGKVEITQVKTTPTFIQHYRQGGKRAYRVLPLPIPTDGKKDPYLTDGILKQAAVDYQEMDRHLHSLSELMIDSTEAEAEAPSSEDR